MRDNITEEDIFPRWLQNKHNLWNKKLTLLNGTYMRYSQLKIPCCKLCNNVYLSRLEKRVSEAFKSGYEACIKLPPLTMYLWAAKIYYGVLRKELFLLHDRSSQESGTIVTDDLMQTLHTLHAFFQGIRRTIEFVGDKPFSVLIANVHDVGNGNNYYFMDDILHETFSLRTGSVGIIVAFLDSGINNKSYAKYLSAINGRKLHPIQFDELYAKVTYESSRVLSKPSFKVATTKNLHSPIQVYSSIFSPTKEWNQEEYAKLLESKLTQWGDKSKDLFVPPNLVHTYMVKEDGNLLLMDREGKEI